MLAPTFIIPSFAVAAALGPADLAGVVAAGFRSVINLRPDGEDRNQTASAALAAAAAAHGLAYTHIPATPLDLFTDPVVGAMARAIAGEQAPVLAFCKSGQRAAIVWAAASARTSPVGNVLAQLRGAGLDLDFLRDELDTQAGRWAWTDTSGAEVSLHIEEVAGRAAA